MALKTALSKGASIVMIEEPFIGYRKICHIELNFHWLQKEKKEIRVMTASKKILQTKLWWTTELILSTTRILCY